MLDSIRRLTMNIFNFKRRNFFSGPHFFGTLLIMVGIVALLSPLFIKNASSLERVFSVAMGAILLGLIIVFSYGGTLIDYTDNRFKDYFSFIGYKMGKWSPLPKISTIKIISIKYMSNNTPNGISPTISGKVTDFRILLYSDASEPTFSFVYTNSNEAIKNAKTLASNLKANLVLNISE